MIKVFVLNGICRPSKSLELESTSIRRGSEASEVHMLNDNIRETLPIIGH